MKAVILSLKEEYDFDFTETDITLDKLLFKKYNIKIPVLMIDGKMFAKYTVDKVKLRRKLTV